MFSKKNNFFLIIFLTTLFFIKTEVTATKLLISVNKNIHLIVDLASTEKEKRRGLMFVEELKNTNGMLFIYEKLKVYSEFLKVYKTEIRILD